MTRLPPEIEERVIGKFDWIRLLEQAPASSPLFTHELCDGRCERLDKQRGYTSHLSPVAICHVGTALALRADLDGTDAWSGIAHLAAKVKRKRATVIAVLKHLEVKQLVYVHVRGGSEGIPRNWASIYMLTRPAEAVMAELAPPQMAAAWGAAARRGRHAR